MALALCASMLAACAGVPPASPAPTVTVPETLADSPPARGALGLSWWARYREPALDALVDEALANNRDLRVASAHLLQARAMLGGAQAERLPDTEVAGGVGAGSTLQDQIDAASRSSDRVRSGLRYDLDTEVSWEWDLFGRLRSNVLAAKADVQASLALEDGVRIAVAAGVTDAWLRACGDAQRMDVARQSLGLRQRRRELVQRVWRAGAGEPVDVPRAEAMVAQGEAVLPTLEAARHDALVELAVLAGRGPDDIPPAAIACRHLPAMDATVPLGDGLALLRRRPDIRVAEKQLEASTARIGIAVASLYPRVSLGAGWADSSPTASGLSARNNAVWRIGPLLSWSFPNRSAARARIAQSRAGEAAALANLDATMLRAFKEVNQASEDYDAVLRRQGALERVAERRAAARQVVQRQREQGAATVLQVLDAESAEIDARADLAAIQTEAARAQVFLFKALGGGWEDAPDITLPDRQHVTSPVIPSPVTK